MASSPAHGCGRAACAAGAAWRRSSPRRHCRRWERSRCSARLADRARDHRGRADVHMVGDLEVAQDHRAAGDAVQWRPMRALPATPTQPAIAVCAPMWHVVADLDQVVELDAVLDHGVVERAAVDAGVGADLDVVADAHRAELLDLDPAPLVGREAEAVGADHRAGCARCRARRCGSLRSKHTRAAPARCPRRPRASAPTKACADDTWPAPMTAPAPMKAMAPMGRGMHLRTGLDTALGWMPGRLRPAACAPPTTG
jgi:hypothetical protein